MAIIKMFPFIRGKIGLWNSQASLQIQPFHFFNFAVNRLANNLQSTARIIYKMIGDCSDEEY
jgi:hypothetical protein